MHDITLPFPPYVFKRFAELSTGKTFLHLSLIPSAGGQTGRQNGKLRFMFTVYRTNISVLIS
jgi:hypothetical protein